MNDLLLHSTLLVGFGFFALAVGVFAMAREQQLKSDLRGAAVLFGVFLVLRVAWLLLESSLPPMWANLTRLVWMLCFAFGVVRLLVAFGLWVWRRLRRGPTTKIHRDVLDFALYLLTAIPILKVTLAIDVTTLLGTSAVLSLVLGFALQDTLSNLFSGLSVQLERPFQVGDWISVGQFTGQVVQIAWRSTRIESFRKELITLPNSLIAKEAVRTLSRNGELASTDLFIGVSYDAPPNRVKAEVLATLAAIAEVARSPAPVCAVQGYEDSSVKYLVRYWPKDFASAPRLQDEVLSQLWYRFGRAGIELPFPQRVVTMRQAEAPAAEAHTALVDRLELFKAFKPEERAQLAKAAKERHFGRGEEVIAEGAEGHSFFVVVRGKVSVRAKAAPAPIATLGEGEYFGEMSLMTGDPRNATVVAVEDSVLLELDRADFAEHIQKHPDFAQPLAELLARRKEELDRLSSSPAGPAEGAVRILGRLRQLFRLRE